MNKYESGATQIINQSNACYECPKKKCEPETADCLKWNLIKEEEIKRKKRKFDAKIRFLFVGGFFGIILGLLFLYALIANKFDGVLLSLGVVFGFVYYVILFAKWLEKRKTKNI